MGSKGKQAAAAPPASKKAEKPQDKKEKAKKGVQEAVKEKKVKTSTKKEVAPAKSKPVCSRTSGYLSALNALSGIRDKWEVKALEEGS